MSDPLTTQIRDYFAYVDETQGAVDITAMLEPLAGDEPIQWIEPLAPSPPRSRGWLVGLAAAAAVAAAVILPLLWFTGGTEPDPATTPTSSISPDTTAPTTTEAPAEGATSVAPSTTVPDAPAVVEAALGPDLPLVVVIEDEVTLHDSATGERIGFVAPFLDYLFAGDIERAADGSIFMYTNAEDYWYSCEGYNGSIDAVVDGEMQTLVRGTSPRVDAAGERLAYLEASDCRPDPDEPALSVVATIDTVVIRDLTTGEESRWTFPGATYRAEDPPVVDGIAWVGDRLVAAVDDHLVTIDPDNDAVPDPNAAPAIEATGRLGGIGGVSRDGALIVGTFDGSADELSGRKTWIVELDVTTGKELRILQTLDGWIRAMAVDSTGSHVVVLGADQTVYVDGVPIAIPVPDGTFIASIGW